MASSLAKSNHLPADKPLVWLMVIAVPIFLYFYLTARGAATDTAILISIISVALISWMFSLMADFIPALLALLLLMLLGLVPTHVALSGFSSNGFLIAFSIMGLGAVITTSGLANRYTLWLLKIIPANTFAYQAAVFFTGFLLNPVVPTITARAALVGPILNNILDNLDPADQKKSSDMLYLSGLDGINLLSPIFLTAAPANLMVFALLPVQEQAGFQFLSWIFSAALAGLILLAAYFGLSAVYFGGHRRMKTDKAEIEKRWNGLEKMSWNEWAALLAIVLLTIGIATASLHRISIPLVAFALICFLLVAGVLPRKAFVEKIDWAFLFFMAGMIGFMAGVTHMGLDQALTAQFEGFKEFMRLDFGKFVLILSGITLVVRLVIPLNPAILILLRGPGLARGWWDSLFY
ncbi:MAG: anion permease [Desulfobacter sp.]|nr:anion permease [Desulfobacter sp.]